jgi:hypothetical protein
MRTATHRLDETAAIHCSSRFSSRLCGGRFNRSGDDSRKSLSRYRPHFFLSLLARRYFFPDSLHRLTVTRRRQVASGKRAPSHPKQYFAASQYADLLNKNRVSAAGGRASNPPRVSINFIFIYVSQTEIPASSPCFQGIISFCFLFSPLICKCARTPGTEPL